MIPEKLPSARPRKARREALKAHIWGLLQQLDVEKQEPQETWQTFFWCEDCTCWEEHVSKRAVVSSMTVEAVECLSMFYVRSFTMLCTVDIRYAVLINVLSLPSWLPGPPPGGKKCNIHYYILIPPLEI